MMGGAADVHIADVTDLFPNEAFELAKPWKITTLEYDTGEADGVWVTDGIAYAALARKRNHIIVPQLWHGDHHDDAQTWGVSCPGP